MSLPRPCLACGEPSPDSWCPDHRRPHSKHKLSAAQRGYDHAWQKLSRQARRLQPWCTWCGTEDDLTADHIRWPAESLNDVQVLCRACNSRKGALRTRGEAPTKEAPRPGAQPLGPLHTGQDAPRRRRRAL